MVVDHYSVLGLPSGKDGAKLSKREIVAAYRRKCKELHPDKRPGNSNAHAQFLKLLESYWVLKDESKRMYFDDMMKKMNIDNMGRGVKRHRQERSSGFQGRESKRCATAQTKGAGDNDSFIDEIRHAVFEAEEAFADIPLGRKGCQLFTRIEKFDVDDIRRAVFAYNKSYVDDIPLGSKGVLVSCCKDERQIMVEAFPLEGVWVRIW